MHGQVPDTYKQILSSPFNTVRGRPDYSQFMDEEIEANIVCELWEWDRNWIFFLCS